MARQVNSIGYAFLGTDKEVVEDLLVGVEGDEVRVLRLDSAGQHVKIPGEILEHNRSESLADSQLAGTRRHRGGDPEQPNPVGSRRGEK